MQLLANEPAHTFGDGWHRPFPHSVLSGKVVGFIQARARAWSGQKGVNFPLWIHSEAGYLSGIVDRSGIEKVPTGACRDERIQVGDDIVLPIKSAQIPIAVDPEAGDFIVVVEGVTAGSDGQDSSGQSTDVFHARNFSPEKTVKSAV